MNEKELRLYTYVNSLYIDYLLFCDKLEENLEFASTTETFNQVFLSDLLFKINDLIKEQYYPKKSIDNLRTIINYLNNYNFETTNIDEKINNLRLLKKINEKFSQINDLNVTENIYFYEYLIKFGTYENLKDMDLNKFLCDKKLIEESIVFDFFAIKVLLDKEFVEDNIDDEKYVYSIKKFFNDLPEMFLDKEINRRAIYILEKHENTSVLVSKLKNIKENLQDSTFDFVKFKSLYDYILVQNILIDNEVDLDYKTFVEENTIETIYTMIDNNLLYNEKGYNNIRKVLYNCLDYVDENKTKEEKREFLKKYNSYMGKLNLLKDYSASDFIGCELINRYGIVKTYIKVFLLTAKKNIKLLECIKTDLDILNIYGLNKEEYIKEKNQLKDKEIYSSIYKFLNIVPSIFNDQTIYSRTIDLLNSSNKLQNKKMLKILKRNFGDLDVTR